MDFHTVQSTIDAHKKELRAFGLTRVGIFGSTAAGTATPQSDIDVLLDFDPQKKTYRNFLGGTACLESILDRPVDPVTPQALSPHIRPSVEQTVTYVQISD